MKRLLIFIYLLITCFRILAQNNISPAAIIGDDPITQEEFKTRFELMPHLSKGDFNTDSAKYEFLYSLISEKLCAKEAERLGYDTTSVFRYAMDPLKKSIMRDALFNIEIGSKIKISSQEMEIGIQRSSFTLRVNIISSGDSSEIFNLHSSLISGAPFDSLLRTRKEYSGQQEPIEITFGDMEEESVEDTLYSLIPGSFSVPVKIKTGWFIFFLKDKISILGNDPEKVKGDVKRIINERRARIFGTEYLSTILKGKRIFPDENLFWKLHGKVYEVLTAKANDSINKYSLTEQEIMKIISEMGSENLNLKFFEFEKTSPTLRDFIYFISFQPVEFFNLEKSYVAGKLNEHLQLFIQQELITAEAFRKGLQDLPYIKSDLEMWRDNFLAQLYRNSFIDSARADDKEAREFYEQTIAGSNVQQVNIIEILNKDLTVFELILDELSRGADFRELAQKYTEREWTRKNNCEFGFFPVTMHGEIGKAAANLKIGEVYGPLWVPEGYSLFKLIDRKEAGEKISKSFEEVKQHVKNNLFTNKMEDILKRVTKQLADKYEVKINNDVVKSANVTGIKMFTYRYLGFGGRITAVPLTAPLYEWFKEWQKEKGIF